MMRDRVIIRKGSFGSWMLGLIFGGMIGGTVALLMAPQPGMQTRAQIAKTGNQLRDRAQEAIEDTRNRMTDVADQARSRINQMMSGGTSSQEDKIANDVNRLNREVDTLESDIDKTY